MEDQEREKKNPDFIQNDQYIDLLLIVTAILQLSVQPVQKLLQMQPNLNELKNSPVSLDFRLSGVSIHMLEIRINLMGFEMLHPGLLQKKI